MSAPNQRNETISSPATPSSSSTTSTGTSGHKNSLKGTKLARRARSFKDDIFEKFSQMRTPTNTLGRSHSPSRHSPRSKYVAKNHSPEVKPAQGLDYHVRQIKNALKHFRDVIAKKKLEVLPGNATVLLELTANMYSALQLYTINTNSNAVITAKTQVYFSLGELIKMCDDVLLSEDEESSPLLSSENVKRVAELLETSVQNLCDIINEKVQEKENTLSVSSATNSSSNTLHRPTIDVAGQRTSLPDIPLTPIERDILEKSSSTTLRTSHSTESILRDSSAPPKPPLPSLSERCSNPPPLPPKRRSQHKQNSITNESTFDSALLSSGLDQVSMRSRSPDDNSSLLSASAGSLDSAFNHSREEDELKILASLEDPFMDDEVDHMLMASFASMQSITTKRSSDYSTQSHKSSITSSMEAASIRNMEAKLGNDTDSLRDSPTNCHSLKTMMCFTNRAFSSIEHCSSSSCDVFKVRHNEYNFDGANFDFEKGVGYTETSTPIKQTDSTGSELQMRGLLLEGDEEPPALPVKTRTKTSYKDRLVSHYDNVAESDQMSRDELSELRSYSKGFHLQSKHQSMIDPRRFQPVVNSGPDNQDNPPPIPKKTKHIMAYMEILPPPNSIRHSVHTCNSQSAYFSSTRSMSTSQTMNITAVSKQVVTHKSSSVSSPPDEKPPALPPKKQHQRIMGITPTIITTPPPSPKPASLSSSTSSGSVHDIRPRITSASNMGGDVMLTVNEEGEVSGDGEYVFNNTHMECCNEPDDEVILRNNSLNKQDSSGVGNKIDDIPNLLEEIDISNYLVLKKPSEDGPDVKGGYVDALIVHAAKVQRNENAFSEAFITTFRTFIPPLELITKLVHRYSVFYCQVNDQQKQKAAKETFSLLVRVVNDLTASDLHLKLLSILTEFVYMLVRSGCLSIAKLLRSKVVEKANAFKTSKINSNEHLEKQRDIAKSLPSLLDLKTVEIAEQMTLLDAELFQKIEIPEVLIFVKEQCEEKSPNLNKFTEHFNKMSYWARSQILSQDDAKDREKYVIKFIKIMKHLRKINNYNSYLALLSALDSAPIRRLEWHKTITEGLKEYCALIDSSSSFRVYRQALAETNPPCIPYIGLVLQDLTFVHVGNPDYLKDGVVNFSKRWQQHNIIVNMKKFKKCAYPFRRNDKIIRFFENFENYLEEEQMWQISESIKPRGRKPVQN